MLTGTMAMRVQAQTGVITHTIRQGETLSALSAKYKTTVGDIMRLNNMNSGSKLAIGQKVKIPASGKTVAASKPAASAPAATTSTPLAAGSTTTHTVKQGETLYRISQTYHVKVDQIKSWNHLKGDNVSIGQVLTIGAYAPESAPVQNTTPAEIPVATTPVDNTPVNTAPPVATTPPPTSSAPVNTTPAAGNATSSTPPATTGTTMANKPEPYVNPSKVTDKGYFESLFGVDVAGRSLEKASGTAMTFKTASGWTDKKYYILVNDIAPGSIVKITNADGNKTIYAKVLWNMGDLKENEGLSYRISNAAADALGISDLKFQITIAYYD
ncbi:LysM peptidoglycan-binding domain-containing protein [Filimonas effusa]|nr:LysM peptidoglycan-binding domain-containing protein [Filimonas effusa]